MKKLKVIGTFVSACIAFCILIYGVYAAVNVSYNISSTVSYIVEDAFAEIKTKIYMASDSSTKSGGEAMVEQLSNLSLSEIETKKTDLGLIGWSDKEYDHKYNSLKEGESGQFKNLTLSLNVAPVYYLVVNIQNLSDQTQYAILADDVVFPEGCWNASNERQENIIKDEENRNIIIAFGLNDFTQQLVSSLNCNIKVGIGEPPVPESTLNKLSFTLSSSKYAVSAINSDIEGVVVIPEVYNGLPVTNLGNYAFDGCSGITKIIIPEGIVSIGCAAFRNCSALTSLNIPKSCTSLWESNLIWGCEKLTSVTVTEGNTVYSSGDGNNCIINIADKAVVAGCKTSTIPSDGSVTSLAFRAFVGCLFEEITIPSCINTIDDQAFAFCTNLKEITIPKNVTTIGDYPFYGSSKLSKITVESGNSTYTSGTSNISLVNISTKELIAGTSKIPTDITVVSIGQNAFYGNSNLTTLTIPSSITTIGSSAFYQCANLTSVTFANSSSLTAINSYVFAYCTSLSQIIIPNYITSLSSTAFNGCSGLKKIIGNSTYSSGANNNYLIDVANKTLILGIGNCTIPSDGSVTKIANYAFSGRDDVTSITIPDVVVTLGSNAFYNCKNLSYIKLPDSIKKIDSSTFSGCEKLTNITLPSLLTTISSGAFSNCKSLKSLTIPKSVTTISVALNNIVAGCDSLEVLAVEDGNANYRSENNCIIQKSTNSVVIGCKTSVIPTTVTKIDGYAFYRIINLENIYIPSSVTSIGQYAFSGCLNLKNITLINGLTTIEKGAFMNCYSFDNIEIPASVKTMGSCAFWGTIYKQSLTINYAGYSSLPSGWDSTWAYNCGASIVFKG